jgi:hypothetical protein
LKGLEYLSVLVEHKYLLLNYYRKQVVMMFDHYRMDNNMMDKVQYKNQIEMDHMKDMMVDSNMMMVKNNMDP